MKKIYLIDDNRDGIQEGKQYLRSDKYAKILVNINKIEEDKDVSFLSDALCIFIHQSFKPYCDGKFVDDYGDTEEKICDYANDNRIPFIEFSEGVNESVFEDGDGILPDYGNMRKTVFYAGLKAFLDRYLKYDEVDIKPLVEGSLEVDLEEETENIDLKEFKVINKDNCPDINDYNSLHAFIYDECRKASGLMFDLDTLSPVKVRYVALMFRLSIFYLKDKAFIPFVFNSESKSLAKVFEEYVSAGAADLLMCGGSYILTSESTPNVKSLTPETYKQTFLDRVKVSPRANSGNHTIANEWGAYVMAEYIGVNRETSGKPNPIKSKDPLYLNYLLASRLSEERIKDLIRNKMVNQDMKFVYPHSEVTKRILFVDDQDEEWEGVIKELFKDENFELTIIGKKNGDVCNNRDNLYLTEGAYYETVGKSGDYDLIILDLRLGGADEENVIESDKLSGMNLLREITKRNPGQQVIVFTSSNKSWNMYKALVNYYAAGYYIKESPDQLISHDESCKRIDEFVKLINCCLEKSYLRRIVEENKKIKEYNSLEPGRNKFNLRCVEDKEILEEISNTLDIAVEMFLSASRTGAENAYKYAFLALEQFFEITRLLHPDSDKDGNALKDNEKGKYEEGKSIPAKSVPKLVLSYDLSLYVGKCIYARNTFIHHNKDREPLVDIKDPKTFMHLWDAIMEFIAEVAC